MKLASKPQLVLTLVRHRVRQCCLWGEPAGQCAPAPRRPPSFLRAKPQPERRLRMCGPAPLPVAP